MSLAGPLASPLSGPLSGPLAGLDNVFNPISLSLLYFDTLGGSMLDSGGAAASHGDTVAVLDDLAESTVSLVLPGTSGNYASVPDEAALDITGDFRIEIDLQDSPTPTTDSVLFSKWTDSGNMRAIRFQWNSTGALRLDISTDGTFDAGNTVVSSVVVSERWVALAWESSTGTTTFYQSPDGANWSQLGVTGTTTDLSVCNTAANVNVGSANAGTLGNFLGSVGQVRFFASTDGTDKRLDIDFTTPAAGSTSFTASTGQTVTINQSGDYPARIGGTSYAAQSTDSLRPVALTETGLYLPGVAGNYASVPDEAALDITGEVTVELQVKLPSYIGNHFFYEKGSNYYFMLSVNNCRFNYGGVNVLGSSPSVSAGDLIWLRARCNPDTGGGNYEVVFEQSTDGETWSNISTETGSGMSPAANNDPLNIGSNTSSAHLNGIIKRARIFASTDGTDKRLDIDFTNPSDAHGATSITAETGQTVTINQSGDDPATLLRYPVARFDGSDDYLSGTFGSTLTGGWMFAVFEVLGSGGESEGTIFSTAPTAAEDFSTGGARWSRKNATFLEANVQSATVALRHNSGFSGRVLHDVIFNGANGGSSRRNDTDEQTTATDVSAIASDRFAIGGSAHNGANNAAIDLHHLSLYPASLTAAEATKVRNYLNNRYNVY